MTKQLNIGMVGYGFMARCHSHAWASVSHFFDTGYHPVLKAVAARNDSKVRRFAEQWGYESVEHDWRALIERRDRHLHVAGVADDVLEDDVGGSAESCPGRRRAARGGTRRTGGRHAGGQASGRAAAVSGARSRPCPRRVGNADDHRSRDDAGE